MHPDAESLRPPHPARALRDSEADLGWLASRILAGEDCGVNPEYVRHRFFADHSGLRDFSALPNVLLNGLDHGCLDAEPLFQKIRKRLDE